MKKYKFLLFFTLLLVFPILGCDDDEDAISDIVLTPVYQITDTGNSDMQTINIYREKNKLAVWNNNGIVTMYETKNYQDNSTDTTYVVSFTALEELTFLDQNQNDSIVTITHDYSVSGEKETGNVTIDILTTYADETTSSVQISGVIKEEEVFTDPD